MIEVTSIRHPRVGAVCAYYCETCKVTVFEINEFAIAPFEGDGYFKILSCLETPYHDLKITLKDLTNWFNIVQVDVDAETILPSIY